MSCSLPDRTPAELVERRFFSPAMIAVLLLALGAFTVLTVVFARYDLAISDAAQLLPGAHDNPSSGWIFPMGFPHV